MQPAQTATLLPRKASPSLDLLLWPQLVGVTALLLAAVDCARVQAGIAPVAESQTAEHALLRVHSSVPPDMACPPLDGQHAK